MTVRDTCVSFHDSIYPVNDVCAVQRLLVVVQTAQVIWLFFLEIRHLFLNCLFWTRNDRAAEVLSLIHI